MWNQKYGMTLIGRGSNHVPDVIPQITTPISQLAMRYNADQ